MYVTIDPSSVKSNPDASAGAVNAVAVPVPTSTIESVCSAAWGGGGLEPEPAGWTSSLVSVLIPIATPATRSSATRMYTAALLCATRCRWPRCCRSSASGSGRTFCVAIRNTSCTSGIPRSFHGSEGLATLARECPHRGRTNAQDARRLLGRIPEQVHEQEGGPLARADLEQELPHVRAHLRLEERIAPLRDRDDLPDRHRRSASAHPEPVQGDAEQVTGRVLDPPDLVPAFPEFQERILHQFLRVVPIPGHEVQGLEEAFVFLLEERVEAGPCLDAFRGELHDLTLCSHDPWMHEDPQALPRMLAGFPSEGEKDGRVHARIRERLASRPAPRRVVSRASREAARAGSASQPSSSSSCPSSERDVGVVRSSSRASTTPVMAP